MMKSYIHTRRDLWTVEQTLEACIDERDAAQAEVARELYEFASGR